jgi:hypothetical protein
MANAAAMMPAGADAKLYDTVRSVAFWASAFEILRPAKNQAYKKIYADLDSIEWNNTACKQRTYSVYGEPADKLHTLPVWLFGEINRLRNDTLHGNPLPPGRLIVPPGKQATSMYAAPLYRMMFTAYLNLKLAPRKPVGGMTKYEAHRLDMYESGKYQRDIEVALGTVLKSDEEQNEAREESGYVGALAHRSKADSSRLDPPTRHANRNSNQPPPPIGSRTNCLEGPQEQEGAYDDAPVLPVIAVPFGNLDHLRIPCILL